MCLLPKWADFLWNKKLIQKNVTVSYNGSFEISMNINKKGVQSKRESEKHLV